MTAKPPNGAGPGIGAVQRAPRAGTTLRAQLPGESRGSCNASSAIPVKSLCAPNAAEEGGQVSVLVVGFSHRSAPVVTLERAALSRDTLAKLLVDLVRAEPVAETFVISTCNRLEVYADVDRFHAGVTAIWYPSDAWAGPRLAATPLPTWSRGKDAGQRPRGASSSVEHDGRAVSGCPVSFCSRGWRAERLASCWAGPQRPQR